MALELRLVLLFFDLLFSCAHFSERQRSVSERSLELVAALAADSELRS